MSLPTAALGAPGGGGTTTEDPASWARDAPEAAMFETTALTSDSSSIPAPTNFKVSLRPALVSAVITAAANRSAFKPSVLCAPTAISWRPSALTPVALNDTYPG